MRDKGVPGLKPPIFSGSAFRGALRRRSLTEKSGAYTMGISDSSSWVCVFRREREGLLANLRGGLSWLGKCFLFFFFLFGGRKKKIKNFFHTIFPPRKHQK